jgi:hypothetical protein
MLQLPALTLEYCGRLMKKANTAFPVLKLKNAEQHKISWLTDLVIWL